MFITVECVSELKGSSVIRVGVVKQFTIDCKGKLKIKRRTTHDASSPRPPNKLLNSTMDRALLTECFYGH